MLELCTAAGRGCVPDTTAAMKCFDVACDGGNADACAAAGRERLASGQTEAGLKQLHTACAAEGQGNACSFLGSLLLSGRYGVPRDPAAGHTLLLRACDDLQDIAACKNLTKQFLAGDGVPADRTKAQKYHDKAYSLVASQLGRTVYKPPLPGPAPGAPQEACD